MAEKSEKGQTNASLNQQMSKSSRNDPDFYDSNSNDSYEQEFSEFERISKIKPEGETKPA